jgi:outer membrane protein OmpA-like peptidoglycan-associated protein
MDNLIKETSPSPPAGRDRYRVLILATLSMLFLPVWAMADATVSLPSPPDITATVDNGRAAPLMRFVNLGRITFVSNKAQLTDVAKRELDKMSAYLIAHPGAERVLLEGHTDWVGGFKFNDKLSDKRALAVQDYLVSKGVDPTLIHWKGHGKHAPVDENWTRLGRDRNRQVELYAIYLPATGVAGR